MPALDMNGAELPFKKLPKVEQNMLTILQAMEDLTPTHFPFVGGIYGDMGTGKTVTGMKLLQNLVPEGEYILYIHTAAGLSTFNNHPELMKRVKVMKYERQEQLVAVAEAIATAKKNEAVNPGKNGPISVAMSRCGGVMLDEYTHMAELDQAWIVRTRAEQFEADGKYKDPHNPAQPDYLTQLVRSREVINGFMEAGIHFVAICHQRYDKDVAQFRPDFPQKTGADFYRVMHSLYYAQAERNKAGQPVRELHLHTDRRFVAKNRVGGLGSTATVEQIVSAYNKWGVNEDATEAPKEVAASPEPVVQATPEATPQVEDAIGDIESLLK